MATSMQGPGVVSFMQEYKELRHQKHNPGGSHLSCNRNVSMTGEGKVGQGC
jgi:hypothetical protein